MWLGHLPVMVLAEHSCNVKGVQGGEAMHAVCLHIAMTNRHTSSSSSSRQCGCRSAMACFDRTEITTLHLERANLTA